MHAVTHLSSDRDRTWRSAFFQHFLIYVYVCFVGNVAVSV